MTRTEPHNAVCGGCGALLVDAHLTGTHDRVLLDAAPRHDGTHEAWNRGDLWLARAYLAGGAFHGSRRRLHVCVIPDKQLELA